MNKINYQIIFNLIKIIQIIPIIDILFANCNNLYKQY